MEDIIQKTEKLSITSEFCSGLKGVDKTPCTNKPKIEGLCNTCYKIRFVAIESIPKPKTPKKNKEGEIIIDNRPRCTAITSKGTNCINFQIENCGTYCKKHFESSLKKASTPEKKEKANCKGLTVKMTPCIRKESEGCQGFCKAHYDKEKLNQRIEETIDEKVPKVNALSYF